ncbi:hypothetical protein SELMODRAFT_406044 [Selaginella moellendorffii]|uniref:Uncharacterized protein n=1 Tax=Selaginella moellendorffii TaxID=88036 RepID=D8R0H3_SELML|nr:hypothetical protein SELMODRAFT_406044 [Selaginella moellendorffii]
MGHIRTRKHTRNCPCPRKPPIPKTGGPLHIRPWTISDFPHRRRQFLLRESKRVIPDDDEYFGQKCTDITETQRHLVPLHALHPNLLNAPDPFHNRKVTSVTEYISHMGKPRTGPLITTEASPYHGNKATSITEYLRYVPPAHLGKDGQDAVLPHYGIKATDATGAFDERAEPTILTYMLPHRPKTAPTVVFPQHVSPAVLVNAIAERRRMFLEKPQPPSMPNSARAPDKSAPMGEALVNTGCSTARNKAVSSNERKATGEFLSHSSDSTWSGNNRRHPDTLVSCSFLCQHIQVQCQWQVKLKRFRNTSICVNYTSLR